MREVINYEPDTFTRCFCILAALVRHGCQYFSSSCACLHSLLPPLPSLSQSGLVGAQFNFKRWQPLQGKLSQCKTVATVVPHFLWPMHLFLLFIFYYICLFIIQGWSARSTCFVPEAKMIKWVCKCTVAHSEESHKWIKGLLVFCWTLSATSSKYSLGLSFYPFLSNTIFYKLHSYFFVVHNYILW